MSKIHVFILFLILPFLSFSQITKISLTDNWKFVNANQSDYANIQLDDSSWDKVDIPHTWNNEDIMDENRGYRRAVSWYRKVIDIPAAYDSKKLVIRFNAVGSKADIYLNGEHLKTHLGAYTAFTVDITDKYQSGKKNILAVKVDNSSSLGEILPPVSGDFSMWGGIYRDVTIEIYNKISFNSEPYASQPILVTTPQVSEDKATVVLKTKVKNSSLADRKIIVSHLLLDKEHNILTQTDKRYKLKKGQAIPISSRFENIKNPNLWSPESPYLYNIKSIIKDEVSDEILQEVLSPFGFRWFSVDHSGFYFNGKRIKLRGAARHQDRAKVGVAIPSEINWNDLKQLKNMGANFVRISHYPQDTEIYRACDELGLIAWSEICIVNEVKKNKDFAHNSKEMLKEMIYQNYNHPSVVMWGAMNELWDYHPEAVQLAHDIEKLTKETDPYRLSCVAFHASTWEKPYTQNSKEMFNISDINGVNVYESWYQDASTSVGAVFDTLQIFSSKKPMFLSEFGAGSDQRIHSYNPQCFDFTPEYQHKFNQWYIDEVEKRDHFVGYSIWNFIDFQVDGRIDTQPNINNKGMVTADREEKEIYYYFQARWSSEPMIHIAGADWTYRVEKSEGKTLSRPITIFSNQKSVELFHNGKTLGVKNVEKGEVTFSVPFCDGKNQLEATSGTLKDILNIEMHLLSPRMAENQMLTEGIYINIGQDHCYFYDPLTKRMWIPDEAYSQNSWGYVGGKPFDSWPNIKGHDGVRKGVAANIKNTILEPLYQTFVIGIEAYKIDVPAGEYEITLYFAEPFNSHERKNTERAGTDESGERVFDVSINRNLILRSLNLSQEIGDQTAVAKSVFVQTEGGITIDFKAIKGKPILNGLKIKKIK